MLRWSIPVMLAVVSLTQVSLRADPPAFDRKVDVVYGRKYGMALTMDVFTPKDNPRYSQHGPAVVWVVSGGWFSGHDWIQLPMIEEFLKRGYTIFAVVHGSQPRFTIPEITQDMNRAVRFIRFHAKDYQIDPDRIGITGGSAGGHLSLMQGTAGDLGDKKASDPVDQTSSRVQAVGCFFPPTDFLNYGKPGENAVGAVSSRISSLHLISRSKTRRPRSSGRSLTKPASWNSHTRSARSIRSRPTMRRL